MPNDYDKLLNKFGDRLEPLKDQLKKEYKKDFIKAINSKIDRNKKHDIMVEDFATPFTPGNEGYQKTGYQWCFTEPLIELDLKNFDLLLFNVNKKSVVLVECKSSIDTNFLGDELKDLSTKIKHSEEKGTHLAKVLGSEIKHMEYVLCVTGKNISEVKEAQKRTTDANIKKVITWVHDSMNGIIKLDSINTHVYGSMNRVSEFNFQGNRTKIEFLYSSHRARIFQIVIAQIYSDKYIRKSIDNAEFNPKLLTKKEIFDCLNDKLKLGCDEITKKEMTDRLADDLIKLGINVRTLERNIEGIFRIISDFLKPEKVVEEILEKYVDYEADKKAEESARKEAVKSLRDELRSKYKQFDL